MAGHMDKERIRSLELELVERDQELAKARLSLKRVEHHKEKLIRENEEMMETLGFSFPEELASSPNRVQPARGREGATRLEPWRHLVMMVGRQPCRCGGEVHRGEL